MFIDYRVISTFGEDIDEHGEGEWIVEQRVFGVDLGATGEGVALDDGHELRLQHVHHADEEVGVFEFIAVESINELLPGVEDDVFGQWKRSQAIVGSCMEFKRALVLKFA